MQTLAIVDGDLVVSAGSYLMLSGTEKIRQDLQFALTEEYGSDIYHPLWGSIVERYLGQPLSAALEQQVSSEVQRVLNNYIAVQADNVNKAIALDIKGLYDTSDIVRSVESMSVHVNYDRITISVVLQTMSRKTITIQRQVSL